MLFRKAAGFGKVTAQVRLLPQERSVFGMTVVLYRYVREFEEPQLFLAMPWGIERRLNPWEYTLVKLTQGAFPGECKSSISVYLNRRTIAEIRRCPEGTRLILRFRTNPRGWGRVEVQPRRPEIYSKMTEYALEKTADL